MKKFKSLFYVMAIMILSLTAFVFETNISDNKAKVYAEENQTNSKDISLTNQNFDSNTSTALVTDPSGWTKIYSQSSATSGVIFISDKDDENDTKFADHAETYNLDTDANPGKATSSYDNRVLMINAGDYTVTQGYKSNTVSLESYSYYEISVLVYTANNAKASIYLNGINEEDTELQVFQNSSLVGTSTYDNWTTYTYFIATNYEKQTVAVELYLGTKTQESTGVVFFDNVKVQKVSDKKYAQDYADSNVNNIAKVAYNTHSSAYNDFDFEAVTSQWNLIGEKQAGDFGDKINMTTQGPCVAANVEYLGLTNTNQNTTALVLQSENGSYFGFESEEDIEINQFMAYRIDVGVKATNISGNININLVENNDVNDFYGTDFEEYSPVTTTISLSSTSGDSINNNYQTVSFYVLGHSLYNTSAKIQLCLGSESETTTGTVAFDDIKVYTLTYNQFKNATLGSNDKKVEFTTITSTPTISNAYFNTGYINDLDATNEITPADWTQTDVQENANTIFGILNTNKTTWNNNGYGLPEILNPVLNIGGTLISISTTTDTNNVLAIVNQEKTYQTVKSPEITLTKDGTHTLTFNYLAVNQALENSILNIYLYDSNDKKIFEDKNVSSNSWDLYSITLKTEYADVKVHFVFEVGTSDAKAKGYVYLDNFEQTTQTITDEEFENLNHAVDLSNLGLNIKGDIKDLYELYNPLLFTESSNEIGFGGMNEDGQLVIQTTGTGTHSFTSIYSLSLSASSYYKFTVKISSNFSSYTETEDDKKQFGALFSIIGISDAKIANIQSTEANTYEIYVFTDSATDVQICFGLTADNRYETQGIATFEDFNFESSTKTAFTKAQKSSSDKVLAYAMTDIEDEDEEDDEESSNTNGLGYSIWWLIGSIVMVLAFVVAIIGWAIRKIKVKKIKIKRQQVYSRDTTIVKDSVIREARDKRDAEVKELEKNLKDVEKYLADLQENHKQNTQKNRHAEITRKAEREFKAYTRTQNKVLKDIEKIKAKIDFVNSAEHLIALEKAIASENKAFNKTAEERKQDETKKNEDKE